MQKITKLLASVLYGLSMTTSGFAGDTNYRPKEGYIPNRDVAEKVAEAVLVPLYGKKILEQKPFKVYLDRDR